MSDTDWGLAYGGHTSFELWALAVKDLINMMVNCCSSFNNQTFLMETFTFINKQINNSIQRVYS